MSEYSDSWSGVAKQTGKQIGVYLARIDGRNGRENAASHQDTWENYVP
jgi:hypothetical protein